MHSMNLHCIVWGLGMSNPARKSAFFEYMREHGVGYQIAARAVGVNINTARSWAYRARKEGLLEAMPPGRRTQPVIALEKAPPPPAPAPPAIHPADVSTIEALRGELAGALRGLDLCEQAESWQAAVAHRKLVRTLRKELKAAVENERNLLGFDTDAAARELVAIMEGDPVLRGAVLAAFGPPS